MIEEGRVQVNGRTVHTLPAFADPETDHITVDGRPISRQAVRKVYIMLNKPARVLAVASDEPGMDRRTVMDLVDHPAATRLFPVGRLAYETSGLLLLTNDGQLANRLTHPRYGVPRTYEAVTRGSMKPEDLARVQKEVSRLVRRGGLPRSEPGTPRTQPGAVRERRGSVELILRKSEADRSLLQITVHAGRTGDMDELLALAGVRVKKLERVAIGPLRLTGLARGRWRELDRHELQALRGAAGPAGRVRQPPAPATPTAGRPARSSPRQGSEKPADRSRRRRPTRR
jgi:23S rRNA pseudouridine2605 synthase